MPMMRHALLGSWLLWLVTAGEVSYKPDVHAAIVEKAFNTVMEDSLPSSPINELITSYKQVIPKETTGTCTTFDCYASRGNADCLLGKCLCPDGYGTKTGEKCEFLDKPLPEWPDITTDTGGSCWIWACYASRGETICENSKCFCKEGYASLNGVCLPLREVEESRVMGQIKLMMKAGAAEPDQMGCPGAEDEMKAEYAAMKVGTRVFDMSVCRKAIQAYQGNPLPLVVKGDLHEPPINNGYQGSDNLRTDLYSLMTLRQWRTSIVQVMAKEFFYSMAMNDTLDGARRLGNVVHTLANTFTASNVVRHIKDPLGQDCENWIVDVPISVDVVNWHLHWNADWENKGELFDCAAETATQAITLWADARKAVNRSYTFTTVNTFIDRLVRIVLCPALTIPDGKLSGPAGGATKEFSSDSWSFGYGKSVLPRGVVDPADADRIIEGWVNELASYRGSLGPDKQKVVPDGLKIPPREVDVCKDPEITHVTEEDLEQVRAGKITAGYLLSARRSVTEVAI